MKRYINLFLLFVIASIPLLDLLHPGLPLTHDGQDHVARIANFYRNLQEGNLIPRWAGNLNWGYGHPVLMFLYPLPSYMASVFHFLGLSFVDSTKLVFAIAYLLSGLSMFLWARSFLGNNPGFLASVAYLLAPYRFVDIYVRGAIGEHVAFIFPPLVMFFLLRLSQKITPRRLVGLAVSFALLLLAHNAVSIMFLPVFASYTFYLFWQNKRDRLFLFFVSLGFVLGVGLASFFILPAFLEGKYTLRDIVTKGEYASRFETLKRFIASHWSYGGTGVFSVEIGYAQWIGVFISGILALCVKGYRRLRLFILSSIIIFWFSIFLMLEQSKPIWDSLTILQKFQFPWRFLSLVVFLTATLLGSMVSGLTGRKQMVILIIIIVGLMLNNVNFWKAKDFLQKPDSFYAEIYPGTTDTGESSPRWSVRFMEELPVAQAEVIEGKAHIFSLTRTSTRHVYSITASQRSRIRENTLFFPGWTVLVDGNSVPVEFQDPKNRGLITYFVDKGKHTVEVRFEETKLRSFANAVSFVSALASIMLLFSGYQRRKSVTMV
jgi:uncharacterized membrane protein